MEHAALSSGINTLVIISSISFALAQYIESTYLKDFSRIQGELLGLKFDKTNNNEGLKEVKDSWDKLTNKKHLSIHWIIVSLVVILISIAVVNSFFWACSSRITLTGLGGSICHYNEWIPSSILVLSLIIVLLLVILAFRWKALKGSIQRYKGDKDDLLTKYNLVQKTLASSNKS